jgi:L-alanine-DL-glutamate epimerase-like enolase superfamily enzyme
MKIEKIDTKKLEMPYTKPLVTATNNFTVARGLLVTVVTQGGVEGYGYADLFPRAGETPETAAHVIETVLKAKALGKVAREYYAGGRTLDAARLKQVFAAMAEEAKTLQARLATQIQEQAKTLDTANIAKLVRDA